jgi:NTE family protein
MFVLSPCNVRTGNFVYFDNRYDTIGPEHVMASGALPPGFPAIRIDGELYWDGGVVTNTPLAYVLSDPARKDTLVFQVDLFSAIGQLPRDLPAVMERHKDILYSSRTRYVTDPSGSFILCARPPCGCSLSCLRR